MSAIDAAVLERHGLKPDEYERIVRALGREPTLTELGIFSVMWSEHCSYKSSRVHLEDAADHAARASCRGRARTPARSTSATASPRSSRSSRTTTRRSSSRIRARRPASAASSATSSRWARGRSRCSTRCASAPMDGAAGARTRRIVEGVVAGIAGYGNSIGIPTVGGEIAFDDALRRQPAGQRASASASPRADALVKGTAVGHRQPGLLRRREDRPRRHPRRDDGVGGVRREVGREAPGGAGRRSVHGEAAARGLPRADADRRADRHPGHGRRRPDLLDLRDGLARRRRRRDRRQPRAAARDRHDALRDHAVRVAGAHAAGRQARARGRGRARSSRSGICTPPTSATSPTTA